MKTIPAEGCAWCDIPRREHGQRWRVGAGYHGWMAPSRGQILTRIRLRFVAKGWLPR